MIVFELSMPNKAHVTANGRKAAIALMPLPEPYKKSEDENKK